MGHGSRWSAGCTPEKPMTQELYRSIRRVLIGGVSLAALFAATPARAQGETPAPPRDEPSAYPIEIEPHFSFGAENVYGATGFGAGLRLSIPVITLSLLRRITARQPCHQLRWRHRPLRQLLLRKQLRRELPHAAHRRAVERLRRPASERIPARPGALSSTRGSSTRAPRATGPRARRPPTSASSPRSPSARASTWVTTSRSPRASDIRRSPSVFLSCRPCQPVMSGMSQATPNRRAKPRRPTAAAAQRASLGPRR